MEHMHMKKIPQKLAMLAVLFLLGNNLAGLTINAEGLQEAASATVTPDTPFPNVAPAFHAHIEYSFQGYVAKGSFTEIPPDISLIQPLYSLDGDTYQTCGEPWDLSWIGTDDAGSLAKLQNQICLYSSQEPLKSYLDKKLDRFFLKLRLVLQNGVTYETQAALIDRGSPQPVPEELRPEAYFDTSLAAYETRPFCGFGRYQLTVRANASAEEITSCLPDTLPIVVKLEKGLEHVTEGVIDCPVTWKPLSLPELIAGESVTIYDAAEEIIIPKGTLLNTPTGIFRIDEPLKLYDQYGLTNEVRLVLNVVSEDGEPTGALREEHAGLEMTFDLKPTGATEIQAYVWSENNPTWKSLPDVSLLDAVNEQPSTENSGYALVINCEQEPYQSYLTEKTAGNTPMPFLIGLTIKGGVYDGRQLILAWPDTYEIPLALPKLGGSGGNELNAGADNKNDSTSEGQRPNLPQNSDNTPEGRLPNLSQNNGSSPEGQRFNLSQDNDNTLEEELPSLTQKAEEPQNTEESQISPPQKPEPYSEISGFRDERQTKENASSNSRSHTQSSRAQSPASTFTSSGQDETGDATETSGLQSMPEHSAADKDRGIFSPLASAASPIIGIAIAALAIIGIAIAAASRRTGRNSNRLSTILQKLHHKRRTTARR